MYNFKGTNQFENSDSNSKYYNFLKLKEWEKDEIDTHDESLKLLQLLNFIYPYFIEV